MRLCIIIGLIVIALGSLSGTSHASEITPDSLVLNMELPTPIKITTKNGVRYFGFTASQYKTVLNLYATYLALGDEHKSNQEEIRLLNLRIELNLERLLLKDEQIFLLKNDRAFLHEAWKMDRDAANKDAKKHKIQIILFTTGGVAVGFILGLIGSLFI